MSTACLTRNRHRTASASIKTLVTAAVVAILAAVIATGSASADVYVAGYGGTTDVRTGQHGDLTVGANFTYSDTTDDVRRVVVDTPAGGVGNPNAVPWEDRCPAATFDTGVCPAESQIGVVELDVTAYLGIFPIPLALTGTISIIQTDPEVPTIVGAYIVPPLGSPVRSYAEFYPVTNGPEGDFRIRSVTHDFPRTVDTGIFGVLPLTITRYEQLLWGMLPSGVPFITNPTRCETWMSYGYAQAYDSNTNADADPLMSGSSEFVSSGEVPTEPDCGVVPEFPISASATVNSGVRGDSPSLTTSLAVPGVGVGDPAPDAARTVVATLPKSINADFMQLGRICPADLLAQDACPESAKIGTARAETPMIVAGLTGDAYLTDADGDRALPDLAIVMRGAIDFTVRGRNRYINGSQLTTTFDNLPQPGFTRFDLTIAGGPGGVLKNIDCPDDQSLPETGPFNFDITGYTGRNVKTDVQMSFAGCYGVTRIFRTKRPSKKLRVRAYYRSRSKVREVRLYVNGHLAAKSKRSPFRFTKSVRKYRPGRKRLTLLVYYDDGAIAKRSTVFRVVRR